MNSSPLVKKIIGRAEKVSFIELGFLDVPARIDTGARTSSLWVSQAQERGRQLEVVFFGKGSPHYTGQIHTFDVFEKTAVASSNGHVQTRYKVRLLMKLRGKKIRAWFTLADRSTQVYPVLVGRNVLLGKFVVDVREGRVLKAAEKERSITLQEPLKQRTDEENRQ
jgi:hypothetical protein